MNGQQPTSAERPSGHSTNHRAGFLSTSIPADASCDMSITGRSAGAEVGRVGRRWIHCSRESEAQQDSRRRYISSTRPVTPSSAEPWDWRYQQSPHWTSPPPWLSCRQRRPVEQRPKPAILTATNTSQSVNPGPACCNPRGRRLGHCPNHPSQRSANIPPEVASPDRNTTLW